MGLVGAICIQIMCAVFSSWTSYLLNVLYCDYRKTMKEAGYKRTRHILQACLCPTCRALAAACLLLGALEAHWQVNWRAPQLCSAAEGFVGPRALHAQFCCTLARLSRLFTLCAALRLNLCLPAGPSCSACLFINCRALKLAT